MSPAALLVDLAHENGHTSEVWSVRKPTYSMNQTRWWKRREWEKEKQDVDDDVKMYDEVSIKRGRKNTLLSWITGGGNEVVTLPDLPITIQVVPHILVEKLLSPVQCIAVVLQKPCNSTQFEFYI